MDVSWSELSGRDSIKDDARPGSRSSKSSKSESELGSFCDVDSISFGFSSVEVSWVTFAGDFTTGGRGVVAG